MIKGLAALTLLDSYSDERVAAAHENLGLGRKSTEFMALPSFAFDLMRQAVLGLAGRHDEVRALINPRQTSAITYRASPLNVADDDRFDAGPVPGAVLPECPLHVMQAGAAPREAHLSDLIDAEFVALWIARGGALPPPLQDPARRTAARGLPLKALCLTRADARGLAPAPAAEFITAAIGRALSRGART